MYPIVTVEPPAATERRNVYVTLRLLPEPCRPGRVVRLPGRTLLALDPRTLRMEALIYCMDNLTSIERDTVRRAYGVSCESAGHPLPDPATEPCVPIILYVPPGLRLPGEPALQGDDELLQREADGELDLEQAMVIRESVGLPPFGVRVVGQDRAGSTVA